MRRGRADDQQEQEVRIKRHDFLYRPPHALLSLMRAAMASPIAAPPLPQAPRARSTRGSGEASGPIRRGGGCRGERDRQ